MHLSPDNVRDNPKDLAKIKKIIEAAGTPIATTVPVERAIAEIPATALIASPTARRAPSRVSTRR
jgi:hypothetical protein